MKENHLQAYNEGKIPLVLAFTENYFIPACTCLFSILSNSTESDIYHVVCLLTEELPRKMKESLEALGASRCTFSFVNLKGYVSEDIYIDDKYTVAASYRLLLPDLLPEYKKVLYLDCDMIIRNNVAKMYRETDISHVYMGGVFEATLDFQQMHMDKIGSKPGEYINSGFLLMNLEALRRDDMVKRFMHAAKEEGLEFPDQDVINQLCKGKILGLAPYWNSIRTFFLPQYKMCFLKYYTEMDWRQVSEHGNIHYTGPKPWNTFTVAFDVWWCYFKRLPNAVQKFGKFDARLYWFAMFYQTSIGKGFINFSRRWYRKFKKGA